MDDWFSFKVVMIEEGKFIKNTKQLWKATTISTGQVTLHIDSASFQQMNKDFKL